MVEEKRKTAVPDLSDRREKSADIRLRPSGFEEFVGQEKLKEKLLMFVQAATGRKEALDHCLFHGPPGLGKTTLAHIIGKHMGVPVKETSGPALEKPGDLASLLTNIPERGVFFIDEIHRLNKVVEESLYPAMQGYQLDIIVGEGPSARSIKLNLPAFTLVGATTRAGKITAAMRERFGIQERLDFYETAELKKIIKRSAGILQVKIDDAGAREIALRSRGTPRIANSYLRRVRDYAQVREEGVITESAALNAFKMFEVDCRGLDPMDRKIIETIITKFSGGPVGLGSLAVSLGEDEETISDVYEPFLIQKGFLARTAKGRTVTPLGFKIVKGKMSSKENGLF